MSTFGYVVKDKVGRTHSGTLEADSRNALVERLWKQDFVVLSIEERSAQRAGLKVGQPKVPIEQLVIFSRQLATMVASGIPIVGAIDVLRDQMENRTFRQLLARIKDDVEGGASLSEGLGKHPRVFSEFFVNMTRAGESSGRLDEILDRVASYLEKADALRRKVQASLFYPGLVSFLAFSITSFLVLGIVPKFKEIFTSIGGELPLPTRMLLAFSEFVKAYIVAEILAGIVGFIAFQVYINSKPGRLKFDKIKLRVPIIGTLLQKVSIARFARTLATLVKSGVPILTSLEIVAKTAGNKVIEQAVFVARSSIKEGENIADPLAQSKVFPPMVTRMISVGEKTGELEKMLSKIADFYEMEVDTTVTALTSIIEPVIIAVLGLIVGAVVIALFLPVITITQHIH
ncbi:MAG: type II secretion system F family protein [Candidatus Omnitrophica bacterium]|nr:type II secretion system F family protein [Candidatus Omnitrophota bacterium]